MKRLLLVPWLCAVLVGGCAPQSTRLGSKKFTESVILTELARGLVQSTGRPVEHRRELGGTQVLFEALVAGEIDAYPEYTGTLGQEILNLDSPATAALQPALAARGVTMGKPIGFNNTYAIGMRRERAKELGITSISHLATHPELKLGFTSEFMKRKDGFPGLQRVYGLKPEQARGMDHDLAYRAIEAGDIDAMDLYSTDADIEYYDLLVLQDDKKYFPEYLALFLYRSRWADVNPDAMGAVERLAGSIDAATMTALNARVKVERVADTRVAATFLSEALGVHIAARAQSRAARLLHTSMDHLVLTGVSLAAAILCAVPMGVWAARRPRWGQAILGLTATLQTIPSLALLVFMIPVLGIGAVPAIAALFLYALLPIVRNTHAGLTGIDPSLLESADALGLAPRARLRLVELPLATPSILAGIKVSAVITVGTATLGALIGAGGYGQPILTGIRLNDHGLILEGAIPAAVLALAVQWLFEVAEKRLVVRQ